jgi:adenosylhomocysteine nucleosidase
MNPKQSIVVLISANAEWEAVKPLFPGAALQPSPYGEWIENSVERGGKRTPLVFFHGGWGKIAAAGSTQYAIHRWAPDLLINLGTCGGIAGEIERDTIVLAERTLVYDIIEQMTDADDAIEHYTTRLDLSWLGAETPQPVRRTLLVSGDRDLVIEEVSHLRAKFGAAAGDWESGAIAWVAQRNGVPCLILRGVSDLVGADGGEVYGKPELYAESTRKIMRRLVEALPEWIENCGL